MAFPRKDDEDRLRRNAPIYDKVQVSWDGIKRGPDLPDDYGWCARTLEWWETWRTCPQSMVMTPTDWEAMLVTALVHDAIWSPSKTLTGMSLTQLTSELRRRESAFGATFEDRRRLAIKLNTPQTESAKEAEITQAAASAVNYAERLNKAAVKRAT